MSVQPKYNRIYVKGRGMMLEHRYVMEQILGRRLLPSEQVHHKDHNTENNDPKNLELMPDDKSHKQEHAYGEEELIRFLIQYNHEYGQFPTYQECAAHLALPHPSTFARVFGSWANAKRRAQRELDLVNDEWEDESIFGTEDYNDADVT